MPSFGLVLLSNLIPTLPQTIWLPFPHYSTHFFQASGSFERELTLCNRISRRMRLAETLNLTGFGGIGAEAGVGAGDRDPGRLGHVVIGAAVSEHKHARPGLYQINFSRFFSSRNINQTASSEPLATSLLNPASYSANRQLAR